MAESTEPMRRPSVPEADREIGVRHPVLTHGFVALVDYMGNDAAIVQAARVSYGQGTKSVRDDRGLIRYLMRHRHTTPFEMIEFKFLVRLPVFVARQWIRHRTACLAARTRIYFDLPRGVQASEPALYSLPIEAVWARFQPTRNRETRRQRNPYHRRDRVQLMHVRVLDETTRTFTHSQIVAVTKSGSKPCFRVTLADGKTIDCTADHRFLFDDGWHSLAEATGLHESDGRAVWDAGEYAVTVNGVQELRPALYRDRKWLEAEYLEQARPLQEIAEVCGVSRATVQLWIRRLGIPRRGRALFAKGNQWHLKRSGIRKKMRPRVPYAVGERTYRSKEWLYARWVGEKLSAPEIARRIDASPCTIRTWLRVHGLTNHPGHTYRTFPEVPWNRGKRYRLGHPQWTAEHRAAVRAARSGSASNFWKGGMSTERESIGRWTTQIAKAIHDRNGWTCQLCHHRNVILHAHHIVPVWADISRARDPANLTSLCDACHREVHRDASAYSERLGGPPFKAEWIPRPRIAWNRIVRPRMVPIARFEFLGPRETFDIEVEGPSHNFVANGVVTHNSVNEYSARYSIVPDEYELPPAEEVRRQSKVNRQGRGDPLPANTAEEFRASLERISKDAYAAYTQALDAGVARETARLVLPVAFYTQWYWKTNLHNLFHFLSLRLDPHAQEEIRLFAAEIARLARLVCPVAFEAFEDFQVDGLSLGRGELRALRALLQGQTPEAACETAGLPLVREDGRPMTSGEGVEFLAKLERVRRLT